MYYYISCETESALFYLISLVHISQERSLTSDSPLIEVICQTINYTIDPKVDEYKWKPASQQGEIFMEVDGDSSDEQSDSDSCRSSFNGKGTTCLRQKNEDKGNIIKRVEREEIAKRELRVKV